MTINMIPTAYMSEVKGDGAGNHLYFTYPPPMATNMVPANFTAYSVQLPHPPPPYEAAVPVAVSNVAKQHDENFPATTGTSASTSETTNTSQQQQQQQQQQQRRSVVPMDEEARKKYRERRDKNNLAAKKSRSNRREREKMMQRKVDELEKENEALRAQLAIYTQQLDTARKEYERQLSLSYTAQQQGMLLRDSSTNLLPAQSTTILYSQFPQQPVT